MSFLDAAALLTADFRASAVPSACQAAERPLDCLTRRAWLMLFGSVGYTVDGVPVTVPEEPQPLYRSSAPSHPSSEVLDARPPTGSLVCHGHL